MAAMATRSAANSGSLFVQKDATALRHLAAVDQPFLSLPFLAGNMPFVFCGARYSGTDERIETLETELESSRKQAAFDKDTAKAELSALRQRHYEVLSQLQVNYTMTLSLKLRPDEARLACSFRVVGRMLAALVQCAKYRAAPYHKDESSST